MPWSEIILRLSAAALIGAVIGLDRELRHKSAGVRTISLVSLGAALATLVITMVGNEIGATSRVIQGILTGIGFLGAGVIVHHRGAVQGLTTAAAIWAAAVLGAGAGLGIWQPVLVGAALALCMLVIAGLIERAVVRGSNPKPPSGRE